MTNFRLITVSSLAHPDAGGPAAVLKTHQSCLSPLEDRCLVLAARKSDLAKVRAEYPEAQVCEIGSSGLVPRFIQERWGYSAELLITIKAQCAGNSLLHAHMLWDYSTYAALQVSSALKRPLVITPHGSCIDGRYLNLHKRIYAQALLSPQFSKRVWMQALSSYEEQALREFGFKGEIRVVPNGVALEQFDARVSPDRALAEFPALRGRRVLLYLGRLWSEKGLDVLPEAFCAAASGAERAEWLLVLAGADYRNYRCAIERRVAQLGALNRILITGPLDSDLKDSLLSYADAVVLPSRSEAFSMSALEALAQRKPLLISQGCHMPELLAAGGALEVGSEVQSLAATLREFFRLSRAQQSALAERGHEFARQHYTLGQVQSGLLSLYGEAILSA